MGYGLVDSSRQECDSGAQNCNGSGVDHRGTGIFWLLFSWSELLFRLADADRDRPGDWQFRCLGVHSNSGGTAGRRKMDRSEEWLLELRWCYLAPAHRTYCGFGVSLSN